MPNDVLRGLSYSAIYMDEAADIDFKKEIQGKFTIEYLDNSEASVAQCECGAKHVHWAAEQHSDWCPAAIFGLKKESKW